MIKGSLGIKELYVAVLVLALLMVACSMTVGESEQEISKPFAPLADYLTDEELIHTIQTTPENTKYEVADEEFGISTFSEFVYASFDEKNPSIYEKLDKVAVGDYVEETRIKIMNADISIETGSGGAEYVTYYFYHIVNPKTGQIEETFVEGENRIVVAFMRPDRQSNVDVPQILWTTVIAE